MSFQLIVVIVLSMFGLLSAEIGGIWVKVFEGRASEVSGDAGFQNLEIFGIECAYTIYAVARRGVIQRAVCFELGCTYQLQTAVDRASDAIRKTMVDDFVYQNTSTMRHRTQVLELPPPYPMVF